MGERPYTLLSCAVSADGYLDDAGPRRLVLSDAADLDRVDAERAAADAILVGATTIRRDDPRLLVRSATRRTARVSHGRPAHPVKVTLTASGDLDPSAHFFTTGERDRLVYAPSAAVPPLRRRLAGAAEVVDAGETVDLAWLLADLAARGVRRLLVEGGGRILSAFLTAGLADELQLVIAPFFVGDPAAPRFALPGHYPNDPDHPMRLAETRRIGDLVLLDYLLEAPTPGSPGRPGEPGTGAAEHPAARPGARPGPGHARGPGAGSTERPIPGRPGESGADRAWLARAVELSRSCPPSESAFSVGAVIVDADGREVASGYSRETGPHDHAEEIALARAAGDPRLRGATLYSSLEPCSARASHPRSCTALILDAGIPRVVFAWREPSIFVEGAGAETLRGAGRAVLELPELGPAVREVNAHLLRGRRR